MNFQIGDKVIYTGPPHDSPICLIRGNKYTICEVKKDFVRVIGSPYYVFETFFELEQKAPECAEVVLPLNPVPEVEDNRPRCKLEDIRVGDTLECVHDFIFGGSTRKGRTYVVSRIGTRLVRFVGRNDYYCPEYFVKVG